MTVLRSVSWDDSKKKRRRAAFVVAVVVLTLPLAPASRVRSAPRRALVSVIVEAAPGAVARARAAVVAAGGEAGRDIAVIDGLLALVPADAIGSLRSQPVIRTVVPDGRVALQSTPDSESGDGGADDDPTTDPGSMWRVTRTIGAQALWSEGVTGRGVDVALIDSGVVPVTGLDTASKVVNGPDLSFESQSNDLRYLDTFGHGTHMAGIIAGNDGSGSGGFAGVAPDARIVNVKVADSVGATDVSQVLAAIDWVVQHREDHGLHIRVLNLSFGTDGVQRDALDPLEHAVAVAWRAGIVVVAAAGNRGDTSNGLDDPARSSHVIAVGADDTNGTASTSDDSIPGWSSSGDSGRDPDVVAPGKSIASLRDPGSSIDQQYSSARVGSRFFRGTGTSTSTAVVSGAVALLLQRRPDLTPDQVKEVLVASAHRVPGARSNRQGAGLVNARDADRTLALFTSGATPAADPSEGSGSLEAARGSTHVADDGGPLVGERDIFGAAWNGAQWAQDSAAGRAWAGGVWNGNRWAGDDWSGVSWAGPAWAPATWTANSWSGASWSTHSWSGNSWSGSAWSGNSWSGNSWSGNSWSFVEGDP